MLDDTSYEQALDYLFSFVDYSLIRSLKYDERKFDLSRMTRFMELLGNPQNNFPVIHVAGTKGKGSVSSLCASSLQAACYRVGLYTSPHLFDYNERIQIDSQPIYRAELIALLEEIKSVIEKVPGLTVFEITTGLGFLYFSRRGVDVAVVEVGLGGRLDATNVVTPMVSVITTISYDHMAVLGDTLAKIAAEKAGIIKPGRSVVCAPQSIEALGVIQQIANEQHAPITLVGTDIHFAPISHSLHGQDISIWSSHEQSCMNHYLEGKYLGDWQPERLELPLLGYHQIENAATAYAALLAAQENGLTTTVEDIRVGFKTVVWPGRFEILCEEPTLVVDSAHNADSALKLRLALDDYFPGRPVVMLFGVSEDKDLCGMFNMLLPRVRQVIATQAIHPRVLEAEKIVAMAHQYGCPAQVVLPLESALQCALEAAGDDAVVVAAGSLFIAASVRQAWQAIQLKYLRRYENKP